MHLATLRLTQFKNYDNARFDFSPAVNVVVGPNGSGKTNLLDAVYFLSLTKSAFQTQDVLSIAHDEDYFLIDGLFQDDDHRTTITVSLQRGQRKAVLADKKAYERVSDHIGRFPVVLIAPNDTDLVREHSEDRRQFFDGVLSQLDAEYLRDYIQYHNYLKQRNSLLKLFSERSTNERRYIDHDLLDAYDEPILTIGERLYERRRQFVEAFRPALQRHYDYLSDGRERVNIVYESDMAKLGFSDMFVQSRHRDVALQRTTLGVHRDDFEFQIDGVALKRFGSQGQQKTFVIALKLAQFDQLEAGKDKKPLLLLDDIFDKLDDRRIAKLIEMMDAGTFGQVFLTDARPERTEQLLANVQAEVKYFRMGT